MQLKIFAPSETALTEVGKPTLTPVTVKCKRCNRETKLRLRQAELVFLDEWGDSRCGWCDATPEQLEARLTNHRPGVLFQADELSVVRGEDKPYQAESTAPTKPKKHSGTRKGCRVKFNDLALFPLSSGTPRQMTEGEREKLHDAINRIHRND